jgi:hypothetical protein
MTLLSETNDPGPVDGNAVAGMLRELFAFDMTTAILACNGCGSTAALAEIRVYGGSMGSIFRCINCDTALLRMARTPRGFTIDMRGAARFQALVPG